MKILIAVSSCSKYEENHQAMRDTWLTEAASLGMDYKFFVEMKSEPKSDVIVTEHEDWAMTSRLKDKVRWAFYRGYDYIFSCFPDTYVRPDRLLTSGFDKFDYFGHVFKHASAGATYYCHGGAGYLISRRAMEPVLLEASSYLNDDCWLGDVLHRYPGVARGHSEDFRQFAGSPVKDNTIVTSHLSYKSNSLGVPYDSSFMYAEHKQWIDSGGILVPYIPRLEERALRWKRRLL